MHRNNINVFIGIQKSVYRDLPIGKLKTILVRIMLSLQKGFEGNSQTGFSVGIDYLPAYFAFEQGIVGGMPVPDSTAVGTPFRCVPTIDYVQRNVIVKTTLHKYGFEFSKRNSHNGSVEPLSFWFEFGKVLDGNLGIKPLCKFDYLSDNLPKIGSYKIMFGSLEFCKLFFGSKGSKGGPASHEFFASDPDVLPEIGLIDNFTSWRKNGNGKMLGVDVYPKDVISWHSFFFLGKIRNNLPIRQQPVCLANPAIRNETGISLEVPVFFDWDCDSLARHNSKFHKEVGFCRECLAVARNVEFNADCINGSGIFTPSISYEGTNNLNIERGVFLAG